MTPKLTPVRMGTPIQLPAEDTTGFVRKPAPADGFSVDTGEGCGFISEKALQSAMSDLQMLRRNGWRARR